jgi:3-deoxy-D-manno-octulosonate 8-phosphate phosphatase (KDO 8-P phosphatase)
VTSSGAEPTIRLVLFDVDGVLTDGSLHYSPSGEEVKVFNARDGVAFALLRKHGVRTGIISGRSGSALVRRAANLEVEFVKTGQSNKRDALDDILAASDLHPGEVAFVGDDVLDLPLAGYVGRFYAPADAHTLVLAAADVVLRADGGRGAAREAAEHVLISHGMSLSEAYAPLIDDHSSVPITQ